jgi:cell division protein FtsQ
MNAQAAVPKTLPSLDYGVGAGVALLLAGLIGFALAKAGGVPMRMELYGEMGAINSEQVRELAAASLSGGFFALKETVLEAQLKTLPWVKAAQVERLWPDRVAVHLKSYQPLARWGQSAVLATDGSLIWPQEIPQLDLHIVGPENQAAAVFQDLAVVQRGIPTSWHLQRWQVSSTGDRQAAIGIDDQSVEVEFGREPVAEKFKLLTELVLPVLKPRLSELAAVDLRYRNGFAVRWLADSQNGEKRHE